MKKLFLLGSLLLSSCGSEVNTGAFATKQGLIIHGRQFPKQEIESVTQITLEALHERKGYPLHTFQGEDYNVYFRDYKPACPADPKGCLNVLDTDNRMIEVFTNNDCLKETKFVNSILHAARSLVEKDQDYDEQDMVLFGPNGVEENVYDEAVCKN
jgi:hypothetical protein